jgi:DNA-binding phage protein
MEARILPLKTIFEALQTHQRRLRAGDELPSMSEIARRAGLHRDTLYALLSGERISLRSQYALSRVLDELETELIHKSKTRLMSIRLGHQGPSLSIGLQAKPILQRR